MQRFNLSAWAITHQPLVLFMIIVLAGAGLYAYLNLGRAEDPSFTIKTMVVNAAWPGATAEEMEEQVADPIEKKLQELPYLDRIESYSRPGITFIRVNLRDSTPPARSVTSGTRCGRRSPTSAAACRPASSGRASTTSSATSIRRSTCCPPTA